MITLMTALVFLLSMFPLSIFADGGQTDGETAECLEEVVMTVPEEDFSETESMEEASEMAEFSKIDFCSVCGSPLEEDGICSVCDALAETGKPESEETPIDEAEPVEEQPSEEDSAEKIPTEEGTLKEESPEEQQLFVGLTVTPDAPEYSVVVEWAIDPTTIDIIRVSGYVWNPDILLYDKNGENQVVLGETRTVQTAITLTSRSTAPVNYTVSYADNAEDVFSTVGSETNGSIPAMENTVAQTETVCCTVTVTDIAEGAQIDNNAQIILGRYTVTMNAAE